MKKILFGLFVISLLVISGCARENALLNSTMKCDDGRIVSISEGCGFNYDFHLKYEVQGSWGIYRLIEIFGDGRYTVKENDEMGSNPVTRGGKLSKIQIEDLMELLGNKFFELPSEIRNNLCMDASGRTITISLNGNTHTVLEYCSENEDYAAIVGMINDVTKDTTIDKDEVQQTSGNNRFDFVGLVDVSESVNIRDKVFTLDKVNSDGTIFVTGGGNSVSIKPRGSVVTRNCLEITSKYQSYDSENPEKSSATLWVREANLCDDFTIEEI